MPTMNVTFTFEGEQQQLDLLSGAIANSDTQEFFNGLTDTWDSIEGIPIGKMDRISILYIDVKDGEPPYHNISTEGYPPNIEE